MNFRLKLGEPTTAKHDSCKYLRSVEMDNGKLVAVRLLTIDRADYGWFCDKEGIGHAGDLGVCRFVPSGFLGWCCLLG